MIHYKHQQRTQGVTVQFNLKWKAEFKRIDMACIKPLPFEYGSIKYNPDSILRYVEIANAHHHKWGYPKTKKCVSCLLQSIAIFSSPFCLAGIICMLPILYWSAFWLFTSWFIEEQRAILLPALLKSMALILFPLMILYMIEVLSERLNISDHDYNMFEHPLHGGSILMAGFVGLYLALLTGGSTIVSLTALLNM